MPPQTLLEIFAKLQASGYIEEMRLHTANLHVHALSLDIALGPNDFVVDKAYRFEGSTSNEDVSELYALSSPKHGFKGILMAFPSGGSESARRRG